MDGDAALKSKIKEYQGVMRDIKKEVSKVVVGQEDTIDTIMNGLLADGHILVEGVPGIAKTLLIRTLAKVTGGVFQRIQFTVDLLPTDITGLTAYNEQKGFYVIKGPVFANYVLADEINRAPPKVQSAMLEAMAERQVTIGKETFPMMRPFFVLATENPIETSGTYPLPEAQIDRFLFKIRMVYPTFDEEKDILKRNIQLKRFEDYPLNAVTNLEKIMEMQETSKSVFLSKEVEQYIVELVESTRDPKKYGIELGKYIEWGASPRASIFLFMSSKAFAMIKGQTFVTPAHIKEVAHNVLRHRIILNYEGLAENVSTDQIITEVLSKVPVP
ncbi:MAG: MoxR family ATPase [Candidatus Aenigmarchaeota archaeon]|nr:MoxR family ATPase [Candidatus Aenigmarchaeota archaeon]